MQKVDHKITNALGQKFYIESAMDFDDTGKMVVGDGFFVGTIVGNERLGGEWCDTYKTALELIDPKAYR